MPHRCPALPLCLLTVTLALAAQPDAILAGDWTRFRGNDGSGVAAEARLPDRFSLEENLLWKVDVPQGTSSPIVDGDRLFLTWFQDDTRVIQCVDANSGKELWQQSVDKAHDEPATPPADPTTPTPVSDGERVYAFFPDAGVFAWDFAGHLVWQRPASVSTTMHGLSSSLVAVDGLIIQVVDQLNGSFIMAYDAHTGETVWKNDRVSGLTGAYSTPVVYRPKNGGAQVITTGALEVVGYDAATGKRIWWVVGKCNAPVSSPVLVDDRLYFCEPVGEGIPFSMVGGMDANKDGKLQAEEGKVSEPIFRLIGRIDSAWGDGDNAVDEAEWDKAFGSLKGKGGLVAIKVGGEGDMTTENFLWSFRKSMPYIPSIITDDKLVLAVNDGGLITAIDAETGAQLNKGRLKKGTSKYYASPVGTADRVVFADTRGVVNLVTRAAQWETLQSVELGDPVFATPAIAGNRLYIRTTKSVYCFGKQ